MSEGRVLVVDDEVDVRKSVSLILSRAGYDLVKAEEGDQRKVKIGLHSERRLAIVQLLGAL